MVFSLYNAYFPCCPGYELLSIYCTIVFTCQLHTDYTVTVHDIFQKSLSVR